MNRNNLWRFVFVVLVVLWSAYEIYPPKNRDLVQFFANRGVAPNDAFNGIIKRATEMQKDHPDRAFANLQDAVGTNDIAKYFPFFDATEEINPTAYILNRLQREAAGKIKLGLDLQGGTSFLVEMDTTKLTNTNDVSGALSQAVEVLRKRVDKFGVAEPVIRPAGDNRIEIQLPGLSNADRESAMKQLQRAAFLEFRLAHENTDEIVKSLATGGTVPFGFELMKRKDRVKGGGERLTTVVVKKKAERGLDGSIIKSAMVIRGNLGEPQISFALNDAGAKTFGEVTRENVGRRLAIVLDGELYSAPNIIGPIETGQGQITGSFDLPEAFELANVLENPLKAPLRIVHSDDVDPTLGKDTIASGVMAAKIGVAAVAVFMLCYYLLAGMVANVALLTNIIILIGVMCSIGTTFTLPGIAGIVLTVGMAVDANVLIYERIREELAKGKSLRGAIAAGYDRAFGTIFDSHVTTLISSVILIIMGTGTIKGFGVSLTIGVAASLFTALVVTRLIFDWLLGRELIKDLKMLHIIKGTNINFMKWGWPVFIATWCLIAGGIAYGVHRGSGVFGVEFAGGEEIIMRFDQSRIVDEKVLRESISKVGVGEVLVGYQRDVTTGSRTLRVTTRAKEGASTVEDSSAKVLAQLQKDFGDSKFEQAGLRKVGPIVGTEIRNAAIAASLVAMLCILAYVAFRYEFSFAVGAVVAIIHDLLLTLGCYFLSGRELNSTTVAAVLTIIGFSINDTIVIFDRIREDLKLGVRGSFLEVMNQALNQTLSRTIITSGTVFLATLSLYVFGGGAVNDFAFTFLVGIATGTYSSIYIASFIVLKWHKGQRPAIGSQVVTAAAGSAAKA